MGKRSRHEWQDWRYELTDTGRDAAARQAPAPVKRCLGCGANERKDAIGYTSIAPLLGYCVECLTRVLREPPCVDCGAPGERTGHQTCQYPQDRP